MQSLDSKERKVKVHLDFLGISVQIPRLVLQERGDREEYSRSTIRRGRQSTSCFPRYLCLNSTIGGFPKRDFFSHTGCLFRSKLRFPCSVSPNQLRSG
ncbi:hypothetical protein OIU76_016272 [Salix suchowensis]|nr:hypothetical protein OIU76_016272 [Salix suchowensis]